jgi:hypothetical protein
VLQTRLCDGNDAFAATNAMILKILSQKIGEKAPK